MASLSSLTRVAMLSSARMTAASTRRVVTASTPARRFLSGDAAEKPAPTPPPPPPPAPPAKRGGSSFLQRLAAFFTGAGVGAGVGYYYLSKEIEGSTLALEKAIAANHRELSDRLAKLEER
ncbi:unnamed protein product [Laminaria digitata]